MLACDLKMKLSSRWITSVLIAVLGLCAHGQNAESKDAQISEAKGMPPRATPADYQAQAQAGSVTVAAEFMGHSVPKPDGPLSTEDYVVVETGFFGAPDGRIKLSIDDFSLRINGKKTPLSSQPYGLVARSLKDPQWIPPEGPKPKSKTGLSTGGQSDSGSPPPPVHVPIELQRAMAQYVQKSSLPEGERALPQAGLIFFQYRGQTKSIRSLELIYAGPAGKATLALQP
jgi:hypothetical protein